MTKFLVAVVAFFSIGAVQAQTCPTPAQLDTDLTAAAQSDVISLSGINPINCPEISMSETWSGGKLIFSDSPESPTGNGKLYYDNGLPATSGTNYNRVFVYHVNSSGSTKRFTVVIKNTAASSGTLTVQRKGTAGPTTSFLYAGKLAYDRLNNSTAGSGVNVAAGAWQRIDTTFDTTNTATGNLLHGIWEYSFTQPHEIAICMLSTSDAPATACPAAAVLSRDTHQRGTFPYADKIYDTASGVTIDTAGDIQQFPIAGNTMNDANAVGTDDTDGSSQTLSGNYGILYRIHLNTVSSDGRNIGFLINPRAGGWGGAVWAMPGGLLAGGKFLIPAGSGSSSDNTKGSVEGRYSPGAGLTVWLQFLPVGGASFPVRAVATPH